MVTTPIYQKQPDSEMVVDFSLWRQQDNHDSIEKAAVLIKEILIHIPLEPAKRLKHLTTALANVFDLPITDEFAQNLIPKQDLSIILRQTNKTLTAWLVEKKQNIKDHYLRIILTTYRGPLIEDIIKSLTERFSIIPANDYPIHTIADIQNLLSFLSTLEQLRDNAEFTELLSTESANIIERLIASASVRNIIDGNIEQLQQQTDIATRAANKLLLEITTCYENIAKVIADAWYKFVYTTYEPNPWLRSLALKKIIDLIASGTSPWEYLLPTDSKVPTSVITLIVRSLTTKKTDLDKILAIAQAKFDGHGFTTMIDLIEKFDIMRTEFNKTIDSYGIYHNFSYNEDPSRTIFILSDLKNKEDNAYAFLLLMQLMDLEISLHKAQAKLDECHFFQGFTPKTKIAMIIDALNKINGINRTSYDQEHFAATISTIDNDVDKIYATLLLKAKFSVEVCLEAAQARFDYYITHLCYPDPLVKRSFIQYEIDGIMALALQADETYCYYDLLRTELDITSSYITAAYARFEKHNFASIVALSDQVLAIQTALKASVDLKDIPKEEMTLYTILLVQANHQIEETIQEAARLKAEPIQQQVATTRLKFH